MLRAPPARRLTLADIAALTLEHRLFAHRFELRTVEHSAGIRRVVADRLVAPANGRLAIVVPRNAVVGSR